MSSNDALPFASHSDLCKIIDSMPIGGIPWQSITVWYQDPHMLFKNMLENPEFAGHFNCTPSWWYDTKGDHVYEHFMSSDWAWKQAVHDTSIIHSSIWGPSLMHCFQDIISKDPETHGSMFVPVILGSNKTTISVTMGHSEYWPLYASIGNIRNNVWHAHGSGLVLVAFLAILKSKPSNLIYPNLYLWHSLSNQSRSQQHWVLPVSAKTVSCFLVYHTRIPSSRQDYSRSVSMPWSTLSLCCMGNRPIYCRLPQTSIAGMHCTELVSKVCIYFALHPINLLLI